MKAQARKILALIMAMVMCLSLAAPAFAASEEAAEAEASAPAAVEVEETEAPEAEEEGELETQAVTGVTSISVDGSKITVVTSDSASNDYDLADGTDQLPKWIKWKIVGRAHVGDPAAGKVVYRISVNTEEGYTDNVTWANASQKYVDVTVPGEANNKVKLTETAVWTPDAATDFYFGTSQAKGFSWQEEQDDGTYRVFFKLATVSGNAFQTGDDDWKYFVAYDAAASNPIKAKEYTSKLKDSDLSSALETAVEWNTTSESAEASKTVDKAGVTINTDTPATLAYAYTVINPTDVDVTTTTVTGDANHISFNGFAQDKETGTFQVSVQVTSKKTSAAPVVSYLSSASEVEEKVKKELASNCEVVSVTAASGNYFTVTVKKNAKSADSLDAAGYHKGVIVWQVTVSGTTKNVAGLYDIAEEKGGFYNGKDPDGANGVQITKGTELLGPVAVKASDVTGSAFATIPATKATETGDGYYVFNSVDEMKDAIKLDSCKESKTVSYVQLVMNKKNGTKENGLVTVAAPVYNAAATNTDLYVATPQTYNGTVYGWYVPDNVKANKDFVKSGSFTVEPASHKTDKQKTTTEVTKKPTCQEEGLEVTKTVCTDCNKVISSSEKVLPKVTDPIETNKTKVLPAGETDPSKAVEKVYFDAEDEKNPDRKHKSNHWIKDFKVTSTTSGTVTTKTTTYTCNFDHVHDELTKVETINKAILQGSGKWNLVTWAPDYTIQNTKPDTAAGANMFGNTVTICDSDIDDATLPLNRATTTVTDPVFAFGAAASAKKLIDMSDGTFTYVDNATGYNVYTSNSTLAKQKDFQAVAIVKNINYAKYTCLTGTATLEVSIYENTDKYTTTDAFTKTVGGNPNALNSEKLAKALADGKVTKVGETKTLDIVIPATSAHQYTAGATVCDRCGTSREAAQSKSQIFTADTVEVSDLDWTGVAAMPKVVVKDTEGNMLIEDVDYITGVEDKNATDVGTYTCVIKGTGDYTGNRISKTYNINKVAATLKKKSAPSKLTASATKKVTGQIKMTVKGGKVSAYKVTGKVSGVSVNKSGKITVKKGNKKAGTLKVKVSMKADKNHTAAKAVTVKVAIKAAPAAKKTTKKK